MLVMMSEDMDVSCTETNWETGGSPGRGDGGVQMSANLGPDNLSIISAACVTTSVQGKKNI